MNGSLVTVLTKAPVPGKVKTRLIPAIGATGAASLHELFVQATLDRLRHTGLPFRVSLSGDDDGAYRRRLAGAGVEVIAQTNGTLGAKMSTVLTGPGRRIVIGTDCLVFDPSWLRAAAHSTSDVAVAPSEDGGYWAISVHGEASPSLHETLFDKIPWSTDAVLSTTLARCRQRGLSVELLPSCYDIDLPSDLLRLLHDTRCPSAVRSLLEALPCHS